MAYQFEFTGGALTPGMGKSCKFLLFLVSAGKEVSFYEAVRNGIVDQPQVDSYAEHSFSRYQTDCSVLKLFVQEMDWGNPRFMYSFYMLLGRRADGQNIEIKPRMFDALARGYHFAAEAKFLRNSEAMSLFEKSSIQARMLAKQMTSPPLVDVLRKMVTLTRPQVVEQFQAVRRLRLD